MATFPVDEIVDWSDVPALDPVGPGNPGNPTGARDNARGPGARVGRGARRRRDPARPAVDPQADSHTGRPHRLSIPVAAPQADSLRRPDVGPAGADRGAGQAAAGHAAAAAAAGAKPRRDNSSFNFNGRGRRLTPEHRAKIRDARFGPNGANAKLLARQAIDSSALAPGPSPTRAEPTRIGLDGQPLQHRLYEPKKSNPKYYKALVDDYRHPPRLRARAEALGLPVTAYDPTLAMAIRHMDGGRARFLQFVELAAEAGDEDAKKFLIVFKELKHSEAIYCSLDLVCASAGVSRVDLLKTVVGIAFETTIDVANLVAAAAHPDLVERTVQSAKRLNSSIGQRDRHALLTHAGFLPTPRGASIIVNANASASSQAAASASHDASMPSFLDDVNEATAARDHVVIDASIIPVNGTDPDEAA